ncbi:ComEC/Rec2 family competence protein [Arthrobacter cryoconiti]
MPAAFATWSGAGIFITLPWAWSAAGSLVALVVGAILALVIRLAQIGIVPVRAPFRSIGLMLSAVLLMVCLSTLLFSIGLRQHERTTTPLSIAVAHGQQLSMTLRLMSAPRPLDSVHGPRQVIFDALVVQARAEGRAIAGIIRVHVIAGAGWEDLAEGSEVSTSGRITPTPLQDPAVGYLHPATAPLNVVVAVDSPSRTLRNGWEASARRVWGHASPDTQGLLPGMVTGERSLMAPGLEAAMKTAGLTHLTAVSGANCTLVLTLLMTLLRSWHIPRFLSVMVAVLGLGGFVAVVGPDPSVLRAATMGAIGALAMVGGRPRRVGTLLSMSIIALIVMDPWLALDYAFILSVVATLGLHLFGKRCAYWLGIWMPQWLAQAAAIPMIAQLLCAPVLVLLQPRLTPFSIPANIAVAPVVALVTTVGTLGMAVTVFVPAVADVCAGISGAGAWWVGTVARWVSAMPGSSVAWPSGAPGVVLMATLGALIMLALASLANPKFASTVSTWIKSRVSRRWRFLLGFGPLTALAAGIGALMTLAIGGL